MSLESIAAGLFNFDATEGLARGTSMGAQMMEVALRDQQMKLDAAQAHANAALSADRNALARRSQMFNELTDSLNRFEAKAKERQAAEWNRSVVAGDSVVGSSPSSGAVDYAGLPSSSPAAPVTPYQSQEPGYTESTGFNTAPAVDPNIPTQMPDDPRSMRSDFWVGAGQSQSIGGAPSSSGPQTFLSAPEGSFNDSASLPTQSMQVAEDKVGQSFMGGGQMVRQDGSSMAPAPIVAEVPVNAGAHRLRADVPYDGRPANVRYNNPGAAYPRTADDAYGVEGYGVIGGGHLIGKYPTPVHGAASNMDLFSKGYKGMTIGAAVRKWRGGNGSLNVPAGYDPRAVIDDSFVNDKGTMVDFFQKMASHESSRFSMPKEGWESAFDMYSGGGVGGDRQASSQPAGMPSGQGEVASESLFPASLLPEDRAVAETRQTFESTLEAKRINVGNLYDLRRRDLELQASMASIDRSAPGYQAQHFMLARERAGVMTKIQQAEDLNREILSQQNILQKSLTDAEAAQKVAHDNQRLYRQSVPESGAEVDREAMVDAYWEAGPKDRLKMRTRFSGDRGLIGMFDNADSLLAAEAKRSESGSESRTWKIGGSDYTFPELVEFYSMGGVENSVRDFVKKDPKLMREVDAAIASQPAAQSTPPSSPAIPSSVPPSEREAAVSSRLQSEAASLLR